VIQLRYNKKYTYKQRISSQNVKYWSVIHLTKPFVFEKPTGMRDTLPDLYQLKRNTKYRMEEVVQQWGYRFLQTSALEFYDTVGEASSILDQQIFKLLDQDGNTLVLRPDMTAPIARVASSTMKNEEYPLRLAYSANVFRAQQREGGRPAEFDQFGVELVGDSTVSADAEVIALMIESIKESGLTNFQVAIGHVGFLNALFLNVLGNEELSEQLKRYLYEKNFVGFRQHVKSLPISSNDQKRLLAFLQLRGKKDVLKLGEGLLDTVEGRKAVQDLRNLWETLEAYDVDAYISLDLTLVSHMSYYTGILFEGYGQKLGFPISNGGRYDELLAKFDNPTPATGFGIHFDRLMEAIDNGGLEESTIYCIVFSEERKLEAISKAKQLRGEGKSIVLQNLSGVENIDQLSTKYKEIIFFMGKREKGVEE
jgi:ATP phosphoribosyltransferase regulatory subunit